MRANTARLAAMDNPEENPAFRRGWTWNIPDRLPSAKPRRVPARSLDRVADEIAFDWRRNAGRA